MSDTPAVSIIIPVYNRPVMVREAIASALAAGGDVPVEVIVVDDGSTDDTWQVLQSYDDPRVRLIRLERNAGRGNARNRGLEAARGAYVKYLDSDDVLSPARLPLEVRAIEETGVEIAVSGWTEVDAGGSRRTFDAPHFASIPDDILAGRAVPVSSALYVARPDWRWDPAIRKLDDWDFFCQAALGVKRIASVPGVAYEWRHHPGQRATDASMLTNARHHHLILHKIEQRLEREGALTPARRARLAQYFYKELRVLSLDDRVAFEDAVEHIRSLDPAFAPGGEERQWFMRAAARVVGFRNAILLHTAIKRATRRAPHETRQES